MLRPSLALLAVLLAAGCSSSPMSRIDANRALYESWPFEIQEAILNGQVLVGMNHEQVEMVLGKPSEVMSRQGKKGEEEVWTYKKTVNSGLGSVLQNTNISMGGSMGGVMVGGPIMGTGTGSGISTPPPETDEQDVVLHNGQVIRADPRLTVGKYAPLPAAAYPSFVLSSAPAALPRCALAALGGVNSGKSPSGPAGCNRGRCG